MRSPDKKFNVAVRAAVCAVMVSVPVPATAEGFESGPNISGESSASERRQLIKDADMRIVVPGAGQGPQRPVRGLSRTEEMEMDDLEYRYQMGLIGEAEYFSRRNAIMQRVGLEPEF